MNSLPGANYVSVDIDDVGSDESDLKTPKSKAGFWKFTTFLFAFFLLISLIVITVMSGDSGDTISENPEVDQTTSTTKRSDSLNALDYQNLLTTYVWPNGKYQLYFDQNPETYDVKIFAKSREFSPKTVELMELRAFAGEIDGVIGSRATDKNSKFTVRIRFGDNIRYYLIGVIFNEETNKLEALPPSELNFDTALLDLENYHYTFDVLSWVDNERIIVEQIDTLISNPIDTTTRYWVAPATDLNQKTFLEF